MSPIGRIAVRVLLGSVLVVAVRAVEIRRNRPFEWSFVSLLALNLVTLLPAWQARAAAFPPMVGVVLPALASLAALAFIVPLSWKRWLATLPAHPRFAVILFGVLLVSYGAMALRLTLTKGVHAGDEIHYIVQARSLVQDRNLDMVPQIDNLSFTEASFRRQHISMRSRPGEAHSHHPFGLPLLLAPGYAAFGVPGALAVLVALSSFLGPLLFLILRHETGNADVAALLALGFSLSLPFSVYAVRPYPELLAGIGYLAAFCEIRCRKRPTDFTVLAAGLILGYTSWLLTRRFWWPAGVLNAMAAIRFFRERRFRHVLLFGIPQVILVLALLGINAYRFAGNDLFGDVPQSAVMGGATSLGLLWGRLAARGAALLRPHRLSAVLFDKRFGLLWTNAFLVLWMPASLVTFVRHFRTQWGAHAIFWGLHLMVNGMAFWAWPAGICHEPRYIVAVLPFLALPCASVMARHAALLRAGGVRVATGLAALSLAGIGFNPFRFDVSYKAYTELHPDLAGLASSLPWHISYNFYLGPIDPLHITLTVIAFTALSFACFSRHAAALSRTAFFLALLGVMTALSLAFS